MAGIDTKTLSVAQQYAEKLALGGAGLQEKVESTVNTYLTETGIEETVVSANLYPSNANVAENKKYSSTGELTDSTSTFSCIDFLKVQKNDVIYLTAISDGITFNSYANIAMVIIAEYDKDKNFISLNKKTWSNAVAVENDETCYIRLSLPKAYISKEISITLNSFPANLEEFNHYFEPYNTSKDSYARADIETIKEDVEKNLTKFVERVPLLLLSGVRTDVFWENILNCMADKYAGIWCGNIGTNKEDRLTINTTDTTSVDYAYIRADQNFINSNVKELNLKMQVVKADNGKGTSKKVLLIGDSFTDLGVYQKFSDDYFKANSMDITWLGTRITNELNHEGRYGWRAYTYTNKAEVSSTSENEGTVASNPFWNPDTSAFDFSYYMSQQGYSGVDIVFINLGINDVARGNHESTDELLSYYSTMINSIHDYDSNIKIVLWLCTNPCLVNGKGTVRTEIIKRTTMRNVITQNFTHGENNIYILPVYYVIDPYNDFNTTDVPVDEYNTTTTVKHCTDTVHLSENGYHHLANQIIAMIKYLSTL